MSDDERHQGGCACGAVRYETTGQPVKTGLCHCRYCQLRTGSAFGVSVYFPADAVREISGDLRDYTFHTESGRSFTTRFCTTCGTSVFWSLEVFPGLVGVAGGTFDPPTYWFDVTREVFTRSRAPFLPHDLPDSFETSPSYVPRPAGEDPA
ncbi:MAG: GFA family protein [Pseudomonadota bacterium]|nr:GFA family protein [Pseudomonadota bacterium]